MREERASIAYIFAISAIVFLILGFLGLFAFIIKFIGEDGTHKDFYIAVYFLLGGLALYGVLEWIAKTQTRVAMKEMHDMEIEPMINQAKQAVIRPSQEYSGLERDIESESSDTEK